MDRLTETEAEAEVLEPQGVDMVAEGMPELDCMHGVAAIRWVGDSLDWHNFADIAVDLARHSRYNLVGQYSSDIGLQQAVECTVGHAHLVVGHTRGAERNASLPQCPFVSLPEVVDHTNVMHCGGGHSGQTAVAVHTTVKRCDDGCSAVPVVLVYMAGKHCDDDRCGAHVVHVHMPERETAVQHESVVDT